MKHVIVVGSSFRKERYKGIVVNTTSRAGWSSELSPFLLGPVKLYDGLVSQTMENGWQYSKVYPEHVNSSGNPSNKWRIWSTQGRSNHRAVRYPMGKGSKPLYSWWKGEKLGYIDARKRIYVPLYARSVVKTSAFIRLKKLYKQEKMLVLWDFDGYLHQNQGMTLEDVLNNSKRPMGHAFVLAMLLEEHPFVIKYLE